MCLSASGQSGSELNEHVPVELAVTHPLFDKRDHLLPVTSGPPLARGVQ